MNLENLMARLSLYGAAFLALAGYLGQYLGIEPLHNQFFIFAVWSYIFFVDALVYRLKGASPAVSRTGEFLALALASLVMCCAFELLNLRLNAWYYINQPASHTMRWGGLGLAWAAVLPSLFITAEALGVFGLFREASSAVFMLKPRYLKASHGAGFTLLGLALAFPGTFWALAFAAPVFLAEPLNHRFGMPSLLSELEVGLPGKTLRLAFSGVVCGLLWNAWNYAAGARWVYNFSFNAGPEVSGLPVVLYAVFAVFAIEAYSLYSLTTWLRGGKTWEEGVRALACDAPCWRLRLTAATVLSIMSVAAFKAVDAHTVRLFIGWL